MKKTKVKIFSLAKTQAILATFLGVIAGIVYAFGGLLVDTLATLELISTTETPGLSYGTIAAFGALIGMPITFGVMGFVVGIAEAIIFNMVAPIIKGINIDIE